jgi:hypothetical protein
VLLKLFLPQAKSVPVPIKHLHVLPLLVTKQIQASTQGISLHIFADQNGKTVDGLSHVGIPGPEKYPDL